MKREEEKARAAKTKCKGITAKRIKDVKNMEYARDRLNMQKDIKGDFRALNCTGKATDKCPRCTKCNSIYRNLSKHWDKLMKPEVCAPAEITLIGGYTLDDIRKEIKTKLHSAQDSQSSVEKSSLNRIAKSQIKWRYKSKHVRWINVRGLSKMWCA